MVSLIEMGKEKQLQEVWFQLGLMLLLFVMFIIDFEKDHTRIDWRNAPLFLNYVTASLLINYWLLPGYFYKRKFVGFGLFFVLIITGVILCEELIMEKIFFPDTRGKGFPGILFTLIEVTPVILILSGAKFAWDAHKKMLEVNELKKAMIDSELQLLRSQVSPHFLFNNLNNLYAHAVDQSPQTPKIVLELSSMLRYMLYDCKETHVLLEKEIDHLNSYIQLNELHVGNRGRVHFDAEDYNRSLLISPMILIVFVENAFKHSLSSLAENIDIDVEIKTNGDTLYFKCENNFEINTNTADLGEGIGLDNVQSRLELLYPGKHELKMVKDAPRFVVELELNLKA